MQKVHDGGRIVLYPYESSPAACPMRYLMSQSMPALSEVEGMKSTSSSVKP